MSKRNTEARDNFFTEHLDAERVKEVFDLSHRDFCRLFYNNSQYDSLRAMGERFEELALREKGGYLASYYLITLQDLICAHIIANIGEELFNNHNFEVKVSKSCVQLTTECKQYLIHGLMGNPEVSTWLGVDNAPIEAIQNNNWKAIVFDLMNNAITAGPSFFIANTLIYDNIQGFEVHVKDTRQNHQEKKYFEKILARRNESDDEDAFSFSSSKIVESTTENTNTINTVVEQNSTDAVKNAFDDKAVGIQTREVQTEMNPLSSLEEHSQEAQKEAIQNRTKNDNVKPTYPNKQNYSKSYAQYKKEFYSSNQHAKTDNEQGLSQDKKNETQGTSSHNTTNPNTTNESKSESKPYYKKPYNKNFYKKNYANNNSNVSRDATSNGINNNSLNEEAKSDEVGREKTQKMKM
jgi:hypothetical protein